MDKIIIEKRHSGYCLVASSHRALLITAQDVLDIMDYGLHHADELEQEAKQQEQPAPPKKEE